MPITMPNKPPPEITELTVAPAVEACAVAEPVFDAVDDAAALPDSGVGVVLALNALFDTL
jgi:hypothetical protein